jgi:protein kinase C substrate 80K-H
VRPSRAHKFFSSKNSEPVSVVVSGSMARPRARAALLAACSLLALALAGAAGSGAGFRGAHPDTLAVLSAAGTGNDVFACDGGATVLPLARFNDDYCDCADGADEPGALPAGGGSVFRALRE